MKHLTQKAVEWNITDLLNSFFSLSGKMNPHHLPETEISSRYNLCCVLSANLGRTALKAGLKALPFPENTEILIPDIVCPTVICTILKAGYRPVLCDVENDLHVSVRTMSEICDKENIRIILVPHLYGLNARIDEIRNWCRDSNIFLIDDAAQAVGLKYKHQYLGTFGDMGLLSFGPYKNIGISRGGFLLLKDDELYVRAKAQKLDLEPKLSVFNRLLSCLIKLHYGRSLYLTLQSMKKRKNSNAGEKKIAPQSPETCLLPREEDYVLSDIEAGLICLTLKRMESIFSERITSASSLMKELKKFSFAECIGADTVPYVRIPIRLSQEFSAQKAVNFLRSKKIEAERIYTPLQLQSGFRKYAVSPLHNAEKLWHQIMLIPNPVQNGAGISRIADAFRQLSTMKNNYAQ